MSYKHYHFSQILCMWVFDCPGMISVSDEPEHPHYIALNFV